MKLNKMNEIPSFQFHNAVKIFVVILNSFCLIAKSREFLSDPLVMIKPKCAFKSMTKLKEKNITGLIFFLYIYLYTFILYVYQNQNGFLSLDFHSFLNILVTFYILHFICFKMDSITDFPSRMIDFIAQFWLKEKF